MWNFFFPHPQSRKSAELVEYLLRMALSSAVRHLRFSNSNRSIFHRAPLDPRLMHIKTSNHIQKQFSSRTRVKRIRHCITQAYLLKRKFRLREVVMKRAMTTSSDKLSAVHTCNERSFFASRIFQRCCLCFHSEFSSSLRFHYHTDKERFYCRKAPLPVSSDHAPSRRRSRSPLKLVKSRPGPDGEASTEKHISPRSPRNWFNY